MFHGNKNARRSSARLRAISRISPETILSATNGSCSTREKGLAFKPAIVALTTWGDRWAAPDGPPVRFEHEGCGGRVDYRLRCARCDDAPALRRVIAIPNRVRIAQ